MFCLLLQLVLHALVLAAQESDFKVLPGKHNFKSKFTVIKTAKKDNFIYDIKYCPKDNVDLFNEIDNELNFYQFITTYQSSDGHRNNIVLEHLDGSTVAEISLKSNSKTYYDIDLKTKKELFKEMVFAIDNLHNKANVCHRSLSLSSFSFYSKVVVEANLFSCVKLTPSFKGSIDAINNDEDYFDILIKLTDFAFSTSINDKFIESVAEYKKGLKRSVSLSNITPEMVSGAKAGDCRKADTWALGVILYGLLYGKEPFTGLFVTNKDQTINAIRDLKYKIPYRWKKDTKAIALLKRLLVKDPNERADISEVMSSEWLNS